MRWDRGGVLALAACLLVAALIGAATPDELPSSRPVAPGPDGVARTGQVHAQVLDVTAARELRSPRGTAYTTHETFVVLTFWGQAQRDLTLLDPELHTADGLTYRALRRGDLQHSFSSAVGQRTTATAVFEVPTARLRGAHVTIRPHVTNGVSPVVRTPTFPLPDPLPDAAGPVTLVPERTEAAR